MKQKFYGQVIQGKVKLINKKDFYLTLWKLNDKEIEMTVAKRTKTRSHNQNRYFHGVIIPLASEYTGYSPEEMKEVFRMLFLSKEVEVDGKTFVIGRSTTELTTVEFEEFNKKCRHWGDEHGVFIPEPNEAEY